METTSPTRTTGRPRFARFGAVVRGLLKLVAVVAAVAMVGYIYALSRTDEAIRTEVEAKLDSHYALHGIAVSVGAADFHKGRGVEIRDVVLRERFGPRAGVEIARFKEVFFACDASLERFVTDPPAVRNVLIRGLHVRAEIDSEGNINATRLFPLPDLDDAAAATPPLRIEEGSVELIDTSQKPPSVMVVRGIQAAVVEEPLPVGATPNQTDPHVYRIRGSATGDHLQSLTFDGQFNITTREWKVGGDVTKVTLATELHQSLPNTISAQLAALRTVQGDVSFQYAVTGHLPDSFASTPQPQDQEASLPDDEWRVQFEVAAKLTGGRVDHPRLPYPLSNLKATIHLNNQGVRLEDISASSGLGALQLSGERVGYDPTSPFSLRGRVRDLSLDDRLAQSLPPELLDTWQSFAPQGVAHVDFVLLFNGKDWVPDLAVELVDVSFAYYRFPYRMQNAVGRIRLTQQRLTIDVRALAGGQLVRINGEFQNPGPDYTGRMNVAVEGAAPLDETLISNLDTGPRDFLRRMNPRGSITVSGEFGRDRPTDDALYKRLTLGLQDCAIKFDDFPYPIEGIEGTIELEDDSLVLKGIRGHNDSAYIICEGSWRPGDGRLELSLSATDVPLDDDLRLALTPEARQAWSDLRARGALDHLQVDVTYLTDEEDLTLTMKAQKWKRDDPRQGSSITIEPVWFPYRMDEVTGIVTLKNGVITCENLTARHGAVTASMNALCSPLPTGGRRLEIKSLVVDRLPVDNELLSALPPKAREAASRLQVEGTLAVQGEFTMETPAEADGQSRSWWNVLVDMENGMLRCGQNLEHIHGGVRLIGSQTDSQVQCRGELEIDSLMYRDVQLTQIRGPMWIDNGRLLFGAWAEAPKQNQTPRRIVAQVMGGQLTGDAQVLFNEENPFTINVQLSQADLSTIALELRKPRQITGQAFASLELKGNKYGQHALRGVGNIRLRNANIYELPVILALLKLLRVREPDKTAFDTGDIEFQLQGEHIYFTKIAFTGDAITLKGNGEMNLDREINLNFYTMVGRDNFWVPVISPAIGLASQQLLMISATGTLDHPEVTRKALPGLENTLNELFPEDGTVQPLPPITPPLGANRNFPRLPFFTR